ncbi:MAG: hypothetical protein GF404_11810 [candidate division Zixibacteria bacterium]|jgi:predicted DNA-binding protein|nr:hypothetical protein [candidate division Zixibacteria bacterium]
MTYKPVRKVRGEHCINVFLSYEMKSRLDQLTERYDRTLADIVRMLIKTGIPIMEGLSQAEEEMMREYIQMFRRMRKIRKLKDL